MNRIENEMRRHTLRLKQPLTSVTLGAERSFAPPQPRADEATARVAADAAAMQGLRDAIAELERNAQAHRARIASELGQTSVELGVQIAERLLGTEIAANRQRLDQIVLSALERIQASRAIAIKAHPLDLQLLRQQLAEHAMPERSTELLAFHPDESCPRGRLKLETDELFIEWDTQRSLTEIRGVLLEETYSESTNP
jgi:flagellar biosynthesis/type III secretory pathway protein FliH